MCQKSGGTLVTIMEEISLKQWLFFPENYWLGNQSITRSCIQVY
jgi:hypothetical protein